MKYFFVVGEASGDLHASNMMKALKEMDPDAEFMFVGGPMMRSVGGACVIPSEKLAFMGFVDVLMHMGDIRKGASEVQMALKNFLPDVVICVDYAGFNFRYVLPFVKEKLPATKCVYYIPPKVWAWKKGRIQTLRTHTDEVLCIFPFEVDFFAKNGLSQAKYVGNPSVDAIKDFEADDNGREGLPKERYIALVPGSRLSEIRNNLPVMLRAARHFSEYKILITGAPGVPPSVYREIEGVRAEEVCFGETHRVIKYAEVALVTSGTATLETALIGTPQVVCYAVKGGGLANFVFKNFFSIPYISLVNIIAGEDVVKELYGRDFRVSKIVDYVAPLLYNEEVRMQMRQKYADIRIALETEHRASANAAKQVTRLLGL